MQKPIRYLTSLLKRSGFVLKPAGADRAFSHFVVLMLAALISPNLSFGQQPAERIPDGTEGEFFEIPDTSVTKHKYKHFLGLLLCLCLYLSGGSLYAQTDESTTQEEKIVSYPPSPGFKVVSADKGALYIKLFAYVRYLNQLGLDSTYTNSFGETTPIDRRNDMQINKIRIQFNGWLFDPKFNYALYVWSNNSAQGLTAQVIVGGYFLYQFNKHIMLGGGIGSLPGVRNTEGNVHSFLTVDNRLIADEFFRPSYTTGIWAKGKVIDKLQYHVMIGNNLSQLGIDAGQLDAGFNTFSGALVWFPTTGEFGLNSNVGGNVGDFENHQKLASRLGAHYTRSNEDRQGVPTSEAFDNVTIRLSDGSVVFKTNLFGPGIQVNNVTYQMASFDAGAKYRGFALEGEYYFRRVDHLSGTGTDALGFDKLLDNGFQLQASSMVIDQTLQLYGTYSKVFGEYGDPWDVRVGLNWFPFKNQVVKWNFEYMRASRIPVGGLSLPYPVGGNGNIVYSSFQVNF